MLEGWCSQSPGGVDCAYDDRSASEGESDEAGRDAEESMMPEDSPIMLSAEEREEIRKLLDDDGRWAFTPGTVKALLDSHDACDKALREAEAQRDEQGKLKAQAQANADGTWRAFIREQSTVREAEARIQKLEAALRGILERIDVVATNDPGTRALHYEFQVGDYEAYVRVKQALAQPAAPEAGKAEVPNG